MEDYMIDSNTIKPKSRGKSDFFSWQLYRWVKKFPNRITIWSATWNCGTGVDHKKRSLYIGDQRDGEWIYARQLRNLCLIGQKLEAYAYYAAHDTANWEDVTDWFWAEYMRIGVCAIHDDYSHNFDERDDERVCRHCGKKEIRITEMVERRKWVDAT
jgi:hypothetical protein